MAEDLGGFQNVVGTGVFGIVLILFIFMLRFMLSIFSRSDTRYTEEIERLAREKDDLLRQLKDANDRADRYLQMYMNKGEKP